jgi:hypothetical protein
VAPSESRLALRAGRFSFGAVKEQTIFWGIMRTLTLLVLAGTIALTATAKGQARLGASAGGTFPVGELGRVDQVGYHVGISLQSMPQLAQFGFRGDAVFSAMRRKATIQDITERIVAVTLGPMIRVRRAATTFPYLVGGIGLYNQSTSPRPVGSTSSTDIGFNLGLGARLALGGRLAYAEARYHHVTSPGGPRFLPVTFGILF